MPAAIASPTERDDSLLVADVAACCSPITDGVLDAAAAELVGWCRDRLSQFKCPTEVRFTGELPRLPTGKLLKRILRENFAADTGR